MGSDPFSAQRQYPIKHEAPPPRRNWLGRLVAAFGDWFGRWL